MNMKYYAALLEGLTPAEEAQLMSIFFSQLCKYLNEKQKNKNLFISIILIKKFSNKKNYFFIIIKILDYLRQNVLCLAKRHW